MPQSLWLFETAESEYASLSKDLKVDAVIVGGGITGITTAYLLKRAGLKVAVLEKGRIANGETGHTSAHLAYVTDARLHQLTRTFGKDAAHAVWDAGLTAIHQIDELVRRHHLDCEFRWVPGYLHASWDDEAGGKSDRSGLERDWELATEFGYAAELLEAVPIAERVGVRFADQALLHPTKYVQGLAKQLPGGGGHLFEESEVDGCEASDGKQIVRCRGHKITCDHVILATHIPLQGLTSKAKAAVLQTHLAAYSSYVLSARLPKGSAASALFWDTASPYNYLRLQERDDHVLAVFGGEDHKTGQQPDTTEPFQRLERRWSRMFPSVRVGKHWSGQVIETNDGLPFIGELSPRQYVATGFAGNGLTFGTFSAMMIRDQLIGAANAWRDLFRPDRSTLRKGLWSYIKENLDYPRYYLQDRLARVEAETIDDVPIGAGRIMKLDGERVAVYRDEQNHVSCHSAVCTHMGCLVRWNSAERTWDCPCHGSRFTPTGQVIAGPAESPLEERVAQTQHR
jgi:glycine/D-amino acid oxidase-like deaminating enzyme/nitrite reductase/ring-hydroxylating ferredoxin subunit